MGTFSAVIIFTALQFLKGKVRKYWLCKFISTWLNDIWKKTKKTNKQKKQKAREKIQIKLLTRCTVSQEGKQ